MNRVSGEQFGRIPEGEENEMSQDNGTPREAAIESQAEEIASEPQPPPPAAPGSPNPPRLVTAARWSYSLRSSDSVLRSLRARSSVMSSSVSSRSRLSRSHFAASRFGNVRPT
jgi:hypothetical protein